jgi:hypothetical protein
MATRSVVNNSQLKCSSCVGVRAAVCGLTLSLGTTPYVSIPRHSYAFFIVFACGPLFREFHHQPFFPVVSQETVAISFLRDNVC